MKTALIITGIVVLIIVSVFILGCCKVSAESDRGMGKILDEEKENRKKLESSDENTKI